MAQRASLAQWPQSGRGTSSKSRTAQTTTRHVCTPTSPKRQCSAFRYICVKFFWHKRRPLDNGVPPAEDRQTDSGRPRAPGERSQAQPSRLPAAHHTSRAASWGSASPCPQHPPGAPRPTARSQTEAPSAVPPPAGLGQGDWGNKDGICLFRKPQSPSVPHHQLTKHPSRLWSTPRNGELLHGVCMPRNATTLDLRFDQHMLISAVLIQTSTTQSFQLLCIIHHVNTAFLLFKLLQNMESDGELPKHYYIGWHTSPTKTREVEQKKLSTKISKVGP